MFGCRLRFIVEGATGPRFGLGISCLGSGLVVVFALGVGRGAYPSHVHPAAGHFLQNGFRSSPRRTRVSHGSKRVAVVY